MRFCSSLCEWRFTFYGGGGRFGEMPWRHCQFLRRVPRHFAVTEIPVLCVAIAFNVSWPTFFLSVIY